MFWSTIGRKHGPSPQKASPVQSTPPLTSNQYTDVVASYVSLVYRLRGISVYREVFAGKSIIGKNRRLDILLVCKATNRAFAIECKYQAGQGTADEKIPYALEDISHLPIAGCVVYAGEGWSDGILAMLRASPRAAYCLPSRDGLLPSEATRELDHLLAMHFAWWDVLTQGKQEFVAQHPLDQLMLGMEQAPLPAKRNKP
jgi:hypothetical protein